MQIEFYVVQAVLSVNVPFVQLAHEWYALLNGNAFFQKTQPNLYPTRKQNFVKYSLMDGFYPYLLACIALCS